MSHPSLLAIKLAYRLMQSGQTELLADRLNRLITYLYTCLQNLQHSTLKPLAVSPDMLTVPSECPHSPIFALLTQHPRSLAKHCQDQGFVVRAVVPPTVPMGTERVRVCLHAGNKEGEIDRLVACVGAWVELQTQAKESGRRIVTAEKRGVEDESGARVVLAKL